MKRLQWTRIGPIVGVSVLTLIVAFVETTIRSTLAQYACSEECKIKLSPFGFRLFPFFHQTTLGRWEADSLELAIDWKGGAAKIHNLRLNSDPIPGKSKVSSKNNKARTKPTEQSKRSIDRFLQRISKMNRSFGNIPMRIHLDGSFRGFTHSNFSIDFQQMNLERDSDGNAKIDLQASILGTKLGVDLPVSVSIGPIPPLAKHPPFSTIPFSIQSKTADYPFRLVAALDPQELQIQGTLSSNKGRADISLQFQPDRDPNFTIRRFDFEAEQLELDSFNTVLENFTSSGIKIDLGRAVANGKLRIESSAEPSKFVINATNLSIKNLSLQNRYLADHPILFREFRFSGKWEKTTDSVRLNGIAHHQDATVHIDLLRSQESIALQLQLSKIDCQSLYHSIPREFVPTLTGIELRGQISGNLRLDFLLSDLEKIRQDPLAPAPGKLDFSFPFLDQCEVVQEPSAIDFQALNSVYRHRFLSAAGTEQERLLGVENSDYIRRSKVPKLVLAFVILEDAQFWKHDGFDREQMQRAFWHNLAQSRFSRGASTISQQTARNLWLGVSRSLSRKVQEAILTSRLEHHVSKSKIAELYLNLIELGPEIHGIASASQFHFGLPPEQLSMIQALHLASMAPAPVGYSRKWVSGKVDDAWMKTLRNQLRRMLVRGLLSHKEYRTEARRPLNLLDRTR